MGLKRFALVLIAALLAGNGEAKEAPQASDLEFLEFLGTFDGDQKNFDPLELSDPPGDRKASADTPRKKPSEEKKKTEGKGNQR